MLRFISLSVFALLHTFLYAQSPTQNIRGTVIDVSSNSTLPFAIVTIKELQVSTTSDIDGNYLLKDVPIGRYTIEASMMSYDPVIIPEVVVTSGKEVFLPISMKENAFTLGEVVIEHKVSKELALNPTATVSAKMLSVEEAKRYAGGFDDPARLVSAFAGVSSNVSNNAIVIRGNNPQALQWKLEGIEIPNPNHFADLSSFGGGGLTALSSQVLANSDFFSGAMPAEYNNALSGVFDIFMRNGNNVKNENTLQVGLLGIDLASEGPFKKNGKSSYLFNYRYSSLALLEPILPKNAGGTKYQDLSYKLNFHTKRAGIFTIWGLGLTDGSGADAKTNTQDWKYDTDRENQRVKQYMGASGLSHKIFLNDNQFVKTTLATSLNGIEYTTNRVQDDFSISPKNYVDNKNYTITLSSYLNSKLNARYSNKTGILITNLNYNLLLKNAFQANAPIETLVSEKGSSTLLSAYTNSTYSLSEKTNLNMGINAQLFTLNSNYTIEPRIGIKHQLPNKQSIGFAYGLHSRLERLNYYFVKNAANETVNKELDFTKSHHIVLSYDVNLTDVLHLKIEPYYQYLFKVPVIKDSSFSMINQQNDWFFDQQLQSTGKGKNYGADITLEKYISKGFYYLSTISLFNSQYQGGDKIWRSTRYNRNYALNFLIGKEWYKGKNKQNVLGLNIRMSYQGGDHYSPINQTQSILTKDVVHDESKAFSKQVSPAFVTHFTASYKINKSRFSQEIAFKIINATQYKEFMGFVYNHQNQQVEEQREAIFIPNLSWKIEF